ncbi:uncharacterized protein LOC143289607 [Babylonia areolata]|uniref:uncharacterized protein LOC143289607 n=1 Tax=Babylonia areolata TaxID=304850 RepID=UPI003FD2B939
MNESDMNRTGQPFEEAQRVELFSCNCKQIKCTAAAGDERSGCVVQFSPEEIMATNRSFQDMDRAMKDMFIIGLISSNIRNGPTTESKRKKQRERKKSRCDFTFKGRSVCRATFLKLMAIGRKKLGALTSHYKKHGLKQRKLKTGGRKNNTRSLSEEETQRVVSFIRQYAEDHAVPAPGRVPGFKGDNQLLPSSSPKTKVYRLYVETAKQAGAELFMSTSKPHSLVARSGQSLPYTPSVPDK